MANTPRNQQGRDRASAQLLPVTQSVPVKPPRGRGRGRGRGSQDLAAAAPAMTSRAPNIIWDEKRVTKLVAWIVERPADRHILYSGSAPATTGPSGTKQDEHPSGKQKKDIHAAIAKHIFDGEDSEYSNNPGRLKAEYWKHLGRFKQTGAGVDANGPAMNLHDEIKQKFPYYDQLDQIWRGIPGFDSDLISSDPTIDHSQDMLSLTQTKDAPSAQATEEEGFTDGVFNDGDNGHAGGDLDGENGEEDHGADMDVDDDGWEVLSLDLDNDEMAGDDDIFPSSVAAMAAGTSSISSSTVAPTGGFFVDQLFDSRHPTHALHIPFSPQAAFLPHPRLHWQVLVVVPLEKKASLASARIKNELQEKLNMQHEQLAMENANADLIHRRELDRMQKDIECQHAKENHVAWQVEVLQLQIRQEEMREKASSSSNIPPP
ncbi:hypothetical protein OG21DRAFT_1486619 [Imleria badia]|nr:hypothetical protein OG21DRAFT_1486619 [Imleria badia]